MLIVKRGLRIRRDWSSVGQVCRAWARRLRLLLPSGKRYGRELGAWWSAAEPPITDPLDLSSWRGDPANVGRLPGEATLAATTDSDLNTLLRRCAEGDHRALRELYDGQGRRLYSIALNICRQPAAAADAVHEAFLNVWQFAARFDPARGSAEAWLTSIVRYRALDITRRNAREFTGVELPDREDEEANALAKLEGAEDVAALRRCLEELDGDKRQLVVLAFLYGLSHNQLARLLGTPLGTIKSSIRRGLAALRGCLEA